MPQAQDPKRTRNRNNNPNRSARQPERRQRPAAQGRPVQQSRPAQQPRPAAQSRRQAPKSRQRPAPAPRQQYEEDTLDLSAAIKGIIAVFLTILIVVIIVMLFAKSLFVSEQELAKNVKTGHLTETEYVFIEQQTQLNEEVVTTKKAKKKTTTAEEDEDLDLPEGLDTSVAGEYTVNDAVWLHPEPSSTSANLTIIPYGAEVKVYGNSNYGWFYLDYNGQVGYAWSSYFTPKS